MRIRAVLPCALAIVAAAIVVSPAATAQAPASGPRLVDNGNDTVTDTQTGLMWEKKTTAVGSGENLRDPRDVDNTYTWAYAVGDWIDKMNGRLIANVNESSFAGYTDWRVPTMAELQTIVDMSQPNRINPIFGPNAPSPYWSSSRREFGSTPDAWYALFGNDIPVSVGVPFKFHVRAVRGGRR